MNPSQCRPLFQGRMLHLAVIFLCLATLTFVFRLDLQLYNAGGLFRYEWSKGNNGNKVIPSRLCSDDDAPASVVNASSSVASGNSLHSVPKAIREEKNTLNLSSSRGAETTSKNATIRLFFNTNLFNCSHPNTHNITAYLERLSRSGMESTAKHVFKSPYIVDPFFDDPELVRKASGGEHRSQKIISVYNCPDFFNIGSFQKCPYSQCVFDRTGGNRSNADLLLFFPTPSEMPPRPMGQIWAYCSWESPVHTNFPEPYGNWKGVFNWTFSYRLNSDVLSLYRNLVWRAEENLLPDVEYQKVAKAKSKTAIWLVSNCKDKSGRIPYINEMKKYIDVDIFGKCGSGRIEHSDFMTRLNNTYRFYLSFENSFCTEYVTEKLFRNFEGRLHIVPVVRGGLEYDKYFPPNTFIDAGKFKGPKELALYLKALSGDSVRYSQMLKEKDRLLSHWSSYKWCDLCKALYVRVQPKTIKDIRTYTSKDACWSASGRKL